MPASLFPLFLVLWSGQASALFSTGSSSREASAAKQKRIDELKDEEIAALRGSIDACREAISAKEKQTTALGLESESHQKAITSLNDALAAKDKEIASLERQFDLSQKQVERAEILAEQSQALYIAEVDRAGMKQWQKVGLTIAASALTGAFAYEVWIDRQ